MVGELLKVLKTLLLSLSLALIGCSTHQVICDVEMIPNIQVDYYQESGEVVMKDTDYFRLKQYLDTVNSCIYK